jgi:NAD kinase
MKWNNILVVESTKDTSNHNNASSILRSLLDFNNLKYSRISYDDLSESFFDNIDLVITLGGDGVFIRVSHFVRDIPVLGINSDKETSEGALKELSIKEEKKIAKILNGDYSVKQRTRARVVMNGKLVRELAINEVYVGTKSQFQVSRYIIEVSGNSEEQRSSGVLIATGTGSSAWYRSAGGKKFGADEESLKFIIREPFSCKLFRPKILSGLVDLDDEIIVKSKMTHGGVIAIDGAIMYPFNLGDEVIIRVCNQKLNVVIPKN